MKDDVELGYWYAGQLALIISGLTDEEKKLLLERM